MNKDNLKRLIKVMEEKKYGFLMACEKINSESELSWCVGSIILGEEANICGTAACIAGHCRLIKSESPADFLGISTFEARRLFTPRNEYVDWEARVGETGFITRDRAVKVLKNWLETGKVDWSVR